MRIYQVWAKQYEAFLSEHQGWNQVLTEENSPRVRTLADYYQRLFDRFDLFLLFEGHHREWTAVVHPIRCKLDPDTSLFVYCSPVNAGTTLH